jgi:putative flippase GtrA
MRWNLTIERVWELVRFYQAALLNTAFGLSAYAVLVWLGLNIYAAQAIAHVMGMTFNYFTYSRHVFRSATPAKTRFILSYAANYLVSVGVLAVMAHFIASPYIAGFATALIVSVLNYFALKHLVFRTREV